MLESRFAENNYTQVEGGLNELKNYEDESFDVILCHNVLEYAEKRENYKRVFTNTKERWFPISFKA
jgi:2-polyprenyl-3-methyl-5-hydroxy-6-metoxy-1,4-benzoquinol methylase